MLLLSSWQTWRGQSEALPHPLSRLPVPSCTPGPPQPVITQRLHSLSSVWGQSKQAASEEASEQWMTERETREWRLGADRREREATAGVLPRPLRVSVSSGDAPLVWLWTVEVLKGPPDSAGSTALLSWLHLFLGGECKPGGGGWSFS